VTDLSHGTDSPGSGSGREKPGPWITEIREDEPVRGRYLLSEKRLALTRAGKPYLSLWLADRTGRIEAKVWEEAEPLSSRIQEGMLCDVEGTAGSYQGRLQLTLSRLEPGPEPKEWDPYVESAPEPASTMLKALRELLGTLRQPHLKALVERFLADRDFVSDFKKAPAAKNFHHSYLGGLLEHTLSVCRLAAQTAPLLPRLDRDLLLAAAFVHDLGKIRELTPPPVINYTPEGRLVGHLVLGSAMVEEKLQGIKGFPRDTALRLHHLILSHHGEYEFGSPKRPKFLEATVLHLLDDLDAKVNGLGRFMEKDRQEGLWTEYHPLFHRYFLKGPIPHPEPDPQEAEPPQGSLFSS